MAEIVTIKEIRDGIEMNMQEHIYKKFFELPEELREMYLRISSEWLDEKIVKKKFNLEHIGVIYVLSALVIGTHILEETTVANATAKAQPIVKQLARELDIKLKPVLKEYKKIQRERKAEEKKKREEAKKKLEKQMKEVNKNAKKMAKLAIEKEQKRTRNTFCKNTIEFITQEDVEDIPTKDLTFIKLDKAIFCLDKDSFKNMVKYAKGQKVRGACKPPAPGKPLDCKWFYPINIGQNVYISEDNYKKIKLDKRKFSLKNKRVVDFTTGLHIMSEKSGKDNVYDLVPENFSIEKVKKTIKKKVVKRNIKQQKGAGKNKKKGGAKKSKVSKKSNKKSLKKTKSLKKHRKRVSKK